MARSPVSPRRREVDRSQTFLAAARKLFFLNGYRGASMQAIARKAGYSKRAVYLDYLNKDELFVTVCAEGLEVLAAKLREVPAADLNLEAGIARILEVFLDFSQEHPQYFRMIFSEATPAIISHCSSALKARIADLERSCLEVLVRLAEQAVEEQILMPFDPWEVAGIFVGAATGIILLSMGGSQTVFSRATRNSLVKKAVWILYQGFRGLEGPIPDLNRWGLHGGKNSP